ncbi:uncharacterized protein TNCV_454311 [Trichonephila clavipes]|nr:uncharacterized protein TNCV_454311 [Trichonephila clavipes]
MLSKGNQRLCLKIKVARAKKKKTGLLEACGKNAWPYRTVALWFKAIQSGRNETVDLRRTGWHSIPQDQIDTLSTLISIDHWWAIQELSLEVGLSHQMVWHIMEMSEHEKNCCRSVPHQLIKVQKWHRQGRLKIS